MVCGDNQKSLGRKIGLLVPISISNYNSVMQKSKEINMISTVKWAIKGVFKADANLVYSEINSIGDSYTPEEVLEKAKDPDTELHKCFEWDDTKAAHLYRINTARKIIQSIVIVKDNSDKKEKPTAIRAIVSKNEYNNKYEPVTLTVRNKDSYERLLAEALRELEMFKRKYSTIKELESIMESIDNLII